MESGPLREAGLLLRLQRCSFKGPWGQLRGPRVTDTQKHGCATSARPLTNLWRGTCLCHNCRASVLAGFRFKTSVLDLLRLTFGRRCRVGSVEPHPCLGHLCSLVLIELVILNNVMGTWASTTPHKSRVPVH